MLDIDTVVVTLPSGEFVPAKAGSGKTNLQEQGLSFNNCTFLKRRELRNTFTLRRWPSVRGAHADLHPNLNVKNPYWRELLRKV